MTQLLNFFFLLVDGSILYWSSKQYSNLIDRSDRRTRSPCLHVRQDNAGRTFSVDSEPRPICYQRLRERNAGRKHFFGFLSSTGNTATRSTGATRVPAVLNHTRVVGHGRTQFFLVAIKFFDYLQVNLLPAGSQGSAGKPKVSFC